MIALFPFKFLYFYIIIYCCYCCFLLQIKRINDAVEMLMDNGDDNAKCILPLFLAFSPIEFLKCLGPKQRER